MKMLITASFLFYSAVSMADYSCQELDSKLLIKNLDGEKVKVELLVRSGNAMKKKVFKGQKSTATLDSYFAVHQFDLKDKDGVNAVLKLSIVPIMSRVPCTGRRVCDFGTHSVSVSAELDYQGKVVSYDCKEENL